MLLKEGEQLEYAEDTDEPERADNHQIPHRTEEPAYIERQGGEEIDDTEKGEYILPRLLRAPYAAHILDGEECREDILQHLEDLLPHRRHPLHTLHNDKEYGQDDSPQE